MKAVKTILIGICTFVFIYLIASFVAWDLNAGNWEDGGRFLVGFVGGLMGVILSGMYYFDLHK